jgi:hypothetical protein
MTLMSYNLVLSIPDSICLRSKRQHNSNNSYIVAFSQVEMSAHIPRLVNYARLFGQHT